MVRSVASGTTTYDDIVRAAIHACTHASARLTPSTERTRTINPLPSPNTICNTITAPLLPPLQSSMRRRQNARLRPVVTDRD